MSLLHQINVAAGKSLGVIRHPKSKPQPNQQAQQDLRKHCQIYEPMQTQGLTGPALAWAQHNNTFRKNCIESDPSLFIRWPVVRKTMYVDASPYLKTEYDYLQSTEAYEDRWLPAIKESWVGNPPRFWLDGRTSGNRVHMAYHLARFMAQTGIDPSTYDSVLEFGGGYGCMSQTLHQLGFKGRYVIYDLPIQSGLQRYYLKQHQQNIIEPDQPGPGITCVCERDKLEPALNQLTGKRLFIATWSLSESPLEVREPFEQATRSFDASLIGYQEQFEQVDNRPYFDKWTEDRPHQSSHRVQIQHLKRSHYLFGVAS